MRTNWDDEAPPIDLIEQMQEMMNQLAGDADAPVEIQELDDRVEIIADIPEAETDDIDTYCDGRTLVIRVSSGSRPWVKRIDLPTYVDAEPANEGVNNGVLELTFDQAVDPANLGFH